MKYPVLLKLLFSQLTGNLFFDDNLSKKDTTETKKCTYCLKWVKLDFYKCPYCGRNDFHFSEK